MKKIFSLIICIMMIFVAVSCTDNARSRTYGGNSTVKLEKGQKLIEATWKENSLWYLTEPMEDGYVPKTKKFQESSSLGIIEGSVTFIESR